jgi:hypothetical protein
MIKRMRMIECASVRGGERLRAEMEMELEIERGRSGGA